MKKRSLWINSSKVKCKKKRKKPFLICARLGKVYFLKSTIQNSHEGEEKIKTLNVKQKKIAADKL